MSEMTKAPKTLFGMPLVEADIEGYAMVAVHRRGTAEQEYHVVHVLDSGECRTAKVTASELAARRYPRRVSSDPIERMEQSTLIGPGHEFD